ncbi:MAG: hypothetical protein ABIN41_12255 [Devosia sp.]
MRLLLFSLLILASAPSAFAADAIADPQSPVGLVGQLIVDSADGRSYDEAFAQTKSSFNVYGLDEGLLLAASGMRRLSQDMTGSGVRANELSILMTFNTPGGKFTPNVQTPPMIPFAFLKDEVCQAGYAVGFPAPDKVYAIDLADAPCSAYSVSDRKAEDYRAIEESIENAAHSMGDAALEGAVRAAYAAAAAHAASRDNYFARDGAFAPLREAIVAALDTDEFKAVLVPAEPAADLEAARICLPSVGTELRIAVNAYGDGLSLVAVTDTRTFSYHYDPHETAEIVVSPAAPCLKA